MATKTKVKATIKQRRAAKLVVENRGNVSKAMREAGYSEISAKNPKNLTESKGWKELMEEHLSEESLTKHHKALLNSTSLDHMVFPLGPDNDDEGDASEEPPVGPDVPEEFKDRTSLTDGDIKEMLKEVNCTVRKIVHGNTARHVYFWAADNKARKDALDMAYKLRGSYAPEKSLNVNIDVEVSDDIKELAKKLNGV